MRQMSLIYGNEVYILPPNWREGQKKYEMYALNGNGTPLKEFDSILDALKFCEEKGLKVVGTTRAEPR